MRWKADARLFARECLHFEPDAWQDEVLEMASTPGRKRVAMKACAGPGKMQPKSMMLHTPDGLKRWGDIRPGDTVFSPDGKPTRVVQTFDNGMRPMFRVTFNDGSSTLSGDEHLWKVRGRTERRHGTWATLTTSQIIERNKCPDGKRNQFEIPRHEAVEWPDTKLPVDPYIMGCWLGDGTRCKGQITTSDDEIIGEIEYRGYDITGIRGYMVNIRGLAHGLRAAGVLDKYSYEKSVPQVYKMSSVQQRTELLRGLMDTDGCIDANDASCEFSSTSKELAEDAVWLVRSLGGKARIKATVKKGGYRKDGAFIKCRDCYRVTVTTPFNPFTLGRKHDRWRPKHDRYLTRYITSIEAAHDEDAMCIEVEHPTRCYLANDFIVTHNTAVEAVLGWHRLACFAGVGEHPKGAAVSITADNLRDNLWAEMAKLQSRSPFLLAAFEWTASRIFCKDHAETWFLTARSFPKAADPETIGRTLSGLHSRFPFYLIDESGDMPPQIVRSAEQGFSGCEDGLIVTAGNTTSQNGLLYHVSTVAREHWQVVSVTADPDEPLRTPRVDVEWAREQIALYGRDNPWVQAYILGQFPAGSINALLTVDEVEAAMARNPPKDHYDWSQVRLGVDVARFGDDRTVIFPRQGLAAFPPRILRHQRTTDIAATVAQMANERQAERIFVDDTGHWGHGVIDNLMTSSLDALGIQFHGAPIDPRYKNRRAEMWMTMADWIRNGGAIPNIAGLTKELTGPTYTFSGGKFQLEDKDQVKKRIGASPDLADALALTFAFPDEPKMDRQLMGVVGRQAKRLQTDWDPYQEGA